MWPKSRISIWRKFDISTQWHWWVRGKHTNTSWFVSFAPALRRKQMYSVQIEHWLRFEFPLITLCRSLKLVSLHQPWLHIKTSWQIRCHFPSDIGPVEWRMATERNLHAIKVCMIASRSNWCSISQLTRAPEASSLLPEVHLIWKLPHILETLFPMQIGGTASWMFHNVQAISIWMITTSSHPGLG